MPIIAGKLSPFTMFEFSTIMMAGGVKGLDDYGTDTGKNFFEPLVA